MTFTLTQFLELLAIVLGVLVNFGVVVRYFTKIEARFTKLETAFALTFGHSAKEKRYDDITMPDFSESVENYFQEKENPREPGVIKRVIGIKS